MNSTLSPLAASPVHISGNRRLLPGAIVFVPPSASTEPFGVPLTSTLASMSVSGSTVIGESPTLVTLRK